MLKNYRTPLFGIFLTATLLVMAKPVYLGFQNYLGYCSRTSTRVPDEEKIRLAISFFLEYYPKDNSSLRRFLINNENYSSKDATEKYKPITYLGIDHFKKTNPDCCQVLRQPKTFDIGPASLIDRVLGGKSSFVEIRYLLKYFDAAGNIKQSEDNVTVAITNCGYVWSGM